MPNTRIVFDDNSQATSPVALALARLTQTLATEVPRLRMEQEDRAFARQRMMQQDSLAASDREYRRGQDERQNTRQDALDKANIGNLASDNARADAEAKAQARTRRANELKGLRYKQNPNAQKQVTDEQDPVAQAAGYSAWNEQGHADAQALADRIHRMVAAERGGSSDQAPGTSVTREVDDGLGNITKTTTTDPGAKTKGASGPYVPSKGVRAMVDAYRNHPYADKTEAAYWGALMQEDEGIDPDMLALLDGPAPVADPGDPLQDVKAASSALVPERNVEDSQAVLPMAPPTSGLPATPLSQGMEATPDTRQLMPWRGQPPAPSLTLGGYGSPMPMPQSEYVSREDLASLAGRAEQDLTGLEEYSRAMMIPGEPGFDPTPALTGMRTAYQRMEGGHADAVKQYEDARLGLGRMIIPRRDELQGRQKSAKPKPAASGASR